MDHLRKAIQKADIAKIKELGYSLSDVVWGAPIFLHLPNQTNILDLEDFFGDEYSGGCDIDISKYPNHNCSQEILDFIFAN